ncbi:MAG: metal ABC transporter substrate-binding protein [Acidimicrobiales bacterium]
MRIVLARAVALCGLVALASGAVACGTSGSNSADARPTVVVTTSVLGDVVRNLVGNDMSTLVVMPAGADPHDFAPSARQVDAMRSADVLVVNGLDQEVSLRDTIDAAEQGGTTVIRVTNGVDLLGDDPHFFTDPVRMRQAVVYLSAQLAAEVDGLDAPEYRDRVAAYLGALDDLAAEVSTVLAAVPAERRVLVTYHGVFAYFADRYDFTVLGTVVPGGSPLAEASAAELSALVTRMEEEGVTAVFTDSSSPDRLAKALASEGTNIDVVELFTESLGPAGSDATTYIDMVRTNARRVAAALG